MFLSLLFRKEVLILAGLTAAFAAPMVRSGELSLGKALDWAVNGIGARQEQTTWSDEQSFGIWAPELSATPTTQNLVPSAEANSSGSASVFKFLESIFEVQTIPANAEVGPATDSTAAATRVNAATNAANPGQGATLTTVPGLDPRSAVAVPSAEPNPATGTASSGRTVPTNSLPDWIPVLDLREIIRFDVSPYWVQQRWPKCTRLDLDADGYYGFRVPLVTDQRVGGLSGALTYSFDAQAVVQRIQFQGSVQDVGPLQQLLTQYFRFSPIADRTDLLAPIHDKAARGMLRYSEPIIETAGQATRLREVAFEINSTQGRYQLSEAYRRLAIE
jgi:hypothetical protein